METLIHKFYTFGGDSVYPVEVFLHQDTRGRYWTVRSNNIPIKEWLFYYDALDQALGIVRNISRTAIDETLDPNSSWSGHIDTEGGFIGFQGMQKAIRVDVGDNVRHESGWLTPTEATKAMDLLAKSIAYAQ